MKKDKQKIDYDVMVVGAGVAGMETAASLGDMGYKVLLVEKKSSIGGKAILLSKVFPTLDCASCIVTPKMAAAAHHPNIDVKVYTEVDEITRNTDGSFSVNMHQKSAYVDLDACTGCGQCEEVCTVTVPDEYNYGLVTRRVAHIPFPQAVPKKAIIDRRGEAPCTYTCPANVKASGYISLVRAGRFKEAFNLHLENAPLVGSLARSCYAPCESDCTRCEKEGTVHIRGIKRFFSDWYYEQHPEPEYGPVEEQLKTKVAIVGSGPAGLSAAFYLARNGHQVTIFEAETQAGGMLRTGIPEYRLPNEIVDRDIKNVTALGVKIKCNTRVKSVKDLKKKGFDAVFIATGASDERKLGIDGEELEGVMGCMEFLRETKIGKKPPEVKGKTVMVIGGGNSAMDPARSAIRMGAKKVIILYRRGRSEMPAHDWEVEGAIEEGVELMLLSAPKKFIGTDGKLTAVEVQAMKLGEPDESGRRRPEVVEGSEKTIEIDFAIRAIGLQPSTKEFVDEIENEWGLLKSDPQTLQTADATVFAGGDCVTSPTMIVNAIGQGRRAAFYMDRQLKGESLDVPFDADYMLEKTDKQQVLDESKKFRSRPPVLQPMMPLEERKQTFECYESVMSEEEAREEAHRCMNCGECSQCMECVNVCPAFCIDFSLRPVSKKLTVGSVVLSTGYEVLDPAMKDLLGYGKIPDVIDGLQMDRLLAPTRPYNSVLRPSDGKEPESIAIVLCNGSRDHTVCNPLCCRIGCMYSVKHAQLVMGALPLADVTIYYIDIRAFGKGYDEFYEQSKGMGVEFVKGKAARIDQLDDGNLELYYEDMEGEGGLKKREHDLVVLTVGFLPNTEAFKLFKNNELGADEFDYVREVDPISEPGKTTVDGLFAAGAIIGVRDIPDTVLHAGAAAAQAAAYLQQTRGE